MKFVRALTFVPTPEGAWALSTTSAKQCKKIGGKYVNS